MAGGEEVTGPSVMNGRWRCEEEIDLCVGEVVQGRGKMLSLFAVFYNSKWLLVDVKHFF